MIIVVYIAMVLIGLWLVYAVFSTIIMRTYSMKMTKTLATSKGVLLTFDDGPHPDYTIQLLTLLRQYEVRAIFFVVGELVEKFPEVIKQMHKEGHMIGIHHQKHRSNWWLLPHQTKKQIDQTKESIEKIIGQKVVLYRPPWGHFNIATLSIASHLQIVMWSHIYKDWKCSNHHLERLLSNPPKDGSIVLLHDNGDTKGANETAPLEMLRYLHMYLEKMQQNNRQFVEPNQVFGMKEGSHQ